MLYNALLYKTQTTCLRVIFVQKIQEGYFNLFEDALSKGILKYFQCTGKYTGRGVQKVIIKIFRTGQESCWITKCSHIGIANYF